MAGIFKSLDQSDVRITPFRTYKLWQEDVNYTAGVTAAPYLTTPTKLISQYGNTAQNLSNYQYCFGFNDTATDKAIVAVNTNDFSIINNLKKVGFAAGEMTNTMDKLGLFVSGSSVATSSIGTYDKQLNPIWSASYSGSGTINDKVMSMGYESSTKTMWVGGNYYLYRAMIGDSGVLTGSVDDWTLSTARGEYWGLNGTYSGSLYAVYSSSLDNNVYLGNYNIAVAGTFANGPIAYNTSSNPTSLKSLIVSNNNVWSLFSDGRLFSSPLNLSTTQVAIQNIAAIVVNNDPYIPYNQTSPTQRLYAATTDGFVLINATMTGVTATYSDIIDCRQYLGVGRQIINMAITKNINSLNPNLNTTLAVTIGSTIALDETTVITINTTDNTINNPIHLGGVEPQMLINGDSLPYFYGVDSAKSTNYTVGSAAFQWRKILTTNSENFTVYKANYNPSSNYAYPDILRDSFDEGNPHFDSNELLTANDKFQRIVHKSIDHLYYKNFLTNNKASFGSGNINKQFRQLEDAAYVVSQPQSKFGQSILPGSVNIRMRWKFVAMSTNESMTGIWNIKDDSFGNLYISSSGEGESFVSPYGNYVFTNGVKLTTTPVFVWPLDDLYKYNGVGATSFSSSFSRGLWPMDSIYSNISVNTINAFTQSLGAKDTDLLGAVAQFTSSLSSSVMIKPGIFSDYNSKYNFDGSDFAISLMVRPSQESTHPSGSVLLTKQGPIEDVRVDDNGNIHSYTVPSKTPYKLSYSYNTKKVVFERGGGNSALILTSSVSMSIDRLYHISAVKSGSTISLNVYNGLETTPLDTVSTTNTVADKDCINLSNVYIGNSYTGAQGFNGKIDNLKLFNTILTNNDISILYDTIGVGDLHIGNVFYNHGMMVLSSIPSRFAEIISVETRGTHTIWENEISCTVSPTEFGMSMNPTTHVYDPAVNAYVFRPYVTGSHFRPFVTTVGLYDDYGRLLVVGKLNTPTQLPTNVDTTLIIRYDR